MTIEKGKEWGEPIVIGGHFTTVHSDHELSQLSPQQLCFIVSGDLHHVLGNPSPPHQGDQRQRVPIDALECTIHFENGETETVMAASGVTVGHLVRPFIHQSRYVVISNAGHIGQHNFAPRAHPNDGKFDVVAFNGSMSIRQRLIARKRLLTGSHIPHPDISITQNTETLLTRETTGERLRVDGIDIAKWRSIHVRVLPDYWQVIT